MDSSVKKLKIVRTETHESKDGGGDVRFDYYEDGSEYATILPATEEKIWMKFSRQSDFTKVLRVQLNNKQKQVRDEILTGINNGKENFLLFGKVGTGKTTISISSFVKHILDNKLTMAQANRYKVLYWGDFIMDALPDALKTSNMSLKSYYSELVDIPFMLLDDVSSTRPTDSSRDRTAELIRRRADRGRITIITSNSDQIDLLNQYGELAMSRFSAKKTYDSWDFKNQTNYRLEG